MLNLLINLEEKAFILGGKNYYAPIQRVEDFLNNRKSEFIGKVKPSYLPGITLSNLQEILPSFVIPCLSYFFSIYDTTKHCLFQPILKKI